MGAQIRLVDMTKSYGNRGEAVLINYGVSLRFWALGLVRCRGMNVIYACGNLSM